MSLGASARLLVVVAVASSLVASMARPAVAEHPRQNAIRSAAADVIQVLERAVPSPPQASLQPTAGVALDFFVSLTNNGDRDAHDLDVHATIPTNPGTPLLNERSITFPCGLESAPEKMMSCRDISVAAHHTTTFAFELTPTEQGSMTNSVTVTGVPAASFTFSISPLPIRRRLTGLTKSRNATAIVGSVFSPDAGACTGGLCGSDCLKGAQVLLQFQARSGRWRNTGRSTVVASNGAFGFRMPHSHATYRAAVLEPTNADNRFACGVGISHPLRL